MINDKHRSLLNLITEKYFSESPLNITQVSNKGITNEVFIVELSKTKVVIRISPEPNTDQFIKERWGMEQATLLQIPTPKVFEIGIHNETVYMILEYIDGTHGTDIALDANSIWVQLGRYAKIIHSIPVEGFGDHMPTPGKFDSNREDFSEFLEYHIDSLNQEDKLLQINALAKEQAEKIKVIFESFRGKEFKIGLNHGDLSLKNTITDKSGKVFLFDWGSSEANIIPHFDLIEVLQSSFNFDAANKDFLAFLNGYGLPEEEFLIIKSEIDTLFLFRALDKLRWAIDKKPEKIDHLKVNLERVLAYLKM